jgi:hypothetical protein
MSLLFGDGRLVRLLGLVALSVAAGMPGHAFAGKVIWAARGFEAPLFVAASVTPPLSTGNVVGQDSWVAPALTTSSAVVEGATGVGATGSLRVNKGASNDGYWTRFTTGMAYTPNRYVTIDWDQYRAPRTATTGEAPVFGMQSYSSLEGGLTQTSGVVVDATTGEVLIQTAASGGALAQTNQFVPASTWRHFRLQLDFVSDTYDVFLNNTRIVTGAGFIDGPRTTFSDADVVGLSGYFDPASLSNTGFANFDNVIVRDGLPTDFNHNGIVDAADYTVWRDQQGQNGWGLAADSNGDGSVNAADLTDWQTDFGRTNGVVTTMSMADYNANGVVDAADYTLWRDNLGKTGFMLPGDGDGDGLVTTLDDDYWRDRFGQTGASAVAAASAVPEPVAGVIAVAMAVSVQFRRLRRNRTT